MNACPQVQHASRSPRSYARIAWLYPFLEYVAFGSTLQAARTTFLETLRGAACIGVFGAGDGRCFDSLLRAAPNARFVSIDSDAAMTSLAQDRVARLGAADRVQFRCEDVRILSTSFGRFDAVVTHFFLDCFTAQDLAPLIPAIASRLENGGPWLFADFAIPPEPAIARWRAKVWIALLCAFFRWQAGHVPRSLPPMESLLRKNGFTCEQERARNAGLIRSAVYRRPVPVL